ncbi:C6 finger domain-containing protein [Phlyctema vagabunda]|uniref:C6 finger domain-containing protein n=1 Tax=Phlyctema vagabunda TaxID=108571 RepID=A0ABR4P1D1_9HELO
MNQVSSTSSVVAQVNRSRKAHRKSRQGCGNCKLRKVKCDESKPKCKRCVSYGVLCNYDSKASELQLSASGAFTIKILPKAVFHPDGQSVQYRVPPVLRFQSIEGSECEAPYQLTEQDAQLVKKFQARTVYTIGNEKNRDVLQNGMINLACSNPYLMHAIITLTLMHDRYLAGLTTPLTAVEAFHYYQSLAQFNKKLSGQVRRGDQDPLWATAMCLGVTSFYYDEARTPEEAWPLKPPSSTDLNWLKMTNGKHEVWRITGPMRNDSLFRVPYPQDLQLFVPKPVGYGLDSLPAELISFCGLDGRSTTKSPYHVVANLLGQANQLNSTVSIIFSFLSFVTSMPIEYKILLQQKDTCALLLLAYWPSDMYFSGKEASAGFHSS